jgi:3-deoxy-D-manno-octulosonic-acid transferase
VIVTTLTRTGLALARSLPEVDRAALLPLDAPELVHRALDAFRPEAFFFTETEIWPTLLTALAQRGVPAFLVSGRVSTRTAGRAVWLRPLYRPALAGVVCCMQTAEDAERVIALGADPALVHVAGSLKFETVAGDAPTGVRTLGEQVGGRPVVVAGSTHEGEEAVVLDACARLVHDHPRLLLLLAPRHPERLESVARLVTGRGLPLAGYTAIVAGERAVPEGAGVVLLDVMGPLAHCYVLGNVAFVGGSLVPVGGHNVLEPARAARPVLVGPHTATTADAVDRILAAGGGVRVHSTDELAAASARLLADPAAADEMGRRARAAIELGEGALARHLAFIDERLAARTSPRAAMA